MATENCCTKVRGSCIFIVAVIIFTLSTEFVDCRTIDETVKDNKAVIKTIKGDGDDVIDCVDIYKQPALNHPLLKNHTIQLQPPLLSSNETESYEGDEIFQDWQQNGECPEGTIPIVRTQPFHHHAASKSIPQFNRTKLEFTPSLGHEYAQVTLTRGKYYGARANLNLWSPKSFDQENSIAQIWVVGGQGEALSTVEAGWIINSRDKRTRLFAFWTGDGYRTGCYNLQCPGFVQISRKYALGAAISPISIYNGKQYDIFINIYKSIHSGHWWLQVSREVIGYWPDSIFRSLKGGADLVSWGGEIVNLQAEGRHTSTQMGSGHFPIEGYGKASFMRNLQYYDASAGTMINKDPESLLTYVTKPTCYSLIVKTRTPVYGIHFYFGGPGFSNICP